MTDETGQTDDAMQDEFDVLPGWTADVVAHLGPDHALPAACQGSGTPAALEWLEDELGLGADTHLLDLGAGTGGPAEHAVRATGTAATLVEPMAGACAAAWRMFGRPVVVGGEGRLPFVDATFDAAWSLGVLCAADDQPGHLAELARVVVPAGRIGLLVFERTVDRLPRQPEGNDFPRYADLHELVEGAGLVVVTECLVSDLDPAPQEWVDAADRVDAEVERRHGHEPAWQHSADQRATLGELGRDGLIQGRLLVCRRTT